MKILLTAINSKYTHSNLALYYLRNSINSDKYNIKIISFSINQNILEIIQKIFLEKPAVICFSVYIWNSEKISKLVPEIKKILPEVKIILGGPETGYNAKNWLNKIPQIDYIISGPGEAAFLKLTETDFSYKDKIVKIKNPHFSRITFPYKKEDFADLKNRFIYYESSRGCPFKCSYCLSSRSDQQLEYREISQVKKELDFLIKQKPDTIKFVDRTFNSNRQRAKEIWQYLINYKTDAVFHFEIHPALLGKQDFALLKTVPSGRFRFEIGVQSTNPETLQAINRAFNLQDIASNLQDLCSLDNIHIHLDIICGLPLQNINHIKKSFNHILKLKPDHFQIGFLKILPGTELEKVKDNYKIINQDHPPYQVISTNTLDVNEMIKLSQLEHLIDNIYNHKIFKNTLDALSNKKKSAWIFYNDLLHFCIKINFDITTKNQNKIGKLLFDYIKTITQKDIIFCLDALRLDWSSTGKEYPAYLKNDFLEKVQKQGRTLLKSIINEHKLSLKKQNLAKIIFFAPTSEEFKNKFIPEVKFIISGMNEITDYFVNYAKKYKFLIKKNT